MRIEGGRNISEFREFFFLLKAVISTGANNTSQAHAAGKRGQGNYKILTKGRKEVGDPA